MWRNYSNLLNSWSHSIFELVGTKLILVFSGWFWKPVDVSTDVGAPLLDK